MLNKLFQDKCPHCENVLHSEMQFSWLYPISSKRCDNCGYKTENHPLLGVTFDITKQDTKNL